jgi:hypothetical protein
MVTIQTQGGKLGQAIGTGDNASSKQLREWMRAPRRGMQDAPGGYQDAA